MQSSGLVSTTAFVRRSSPRSYTGSCFARFLHLFRRPSVRLNDYVEAGYSSRKIASSLSQNTVQVSVCPSIGRER